MAEKYGEKPKLFTKKWWEYFWDYYKLQTIVVMVVMFMIIITVYQFVTSPKYDFNVIYAGAYDLNDKNAEQLRKKMSEFVTDSDGDGKDGVSLNRNFFVEDGADIRVIYASVTKMQLEVTNPNSILYIFDDTKAQYYVGPGMEGVFLQAKEWLFEDISDDRLYMADEKACAVSLKGSKFLEELGIDSENLYIAVINHNEDIDEEMQEKIADAKNIANAIIK